MAEKILNTRIQLKIDTWQNWLDSKLILKDGEVGFVRIPAETGEMTTEPTVLFKVGNGEDLFKDLPWPSALAGDVHEWAKAEDKPSYEAKEITGIDAYIAAYVNDQMGISVDTDTQYQIVKVDDYNYKLQSKGKSDEAWADVVGSAFVIPNDTEAIAAALKAGQDAQNAIDAYIESNDAALAAEIKRAGDAEAALAAKMGEVAEGSTLAGLISAEAERAAAAEGVNAEAAAAAQKAADDLAAKVGEVPADQTVMGIITNIQENAYDDTEIRGLISDNADAIAAEKERAEGIEGGLETRLKAVEDDYLKNADKEALQGAIDTEKGRVDTLVGEDANKSVRTIANEELAKQLIAEGAQESLDTLAEIAQWIQDHPGDAAAMNKAIEDLSALVGTLPEGATATTVVGYVDEVVAALKIGDYAKASDLLALTGRVEAMEAKVAAWDAAEQNAKDYADGLNTAMNTRMEAVEGKAHEHANKGELDLIAAGDKAKWDAAAEKAHEHENKALLDTYTQTEENLADAVAKKHEHGNKDVLDGIDADKVAAWDAKANDADLAAIAKDGNVNNLVQTDGDVLVLCCGDAEVATANA